ncbi:MAG: O-methyltransferase [Acidimicrobiales bacterium]
MPDDTWTEVDRYIGGRLIGTDAALDAALSASAAAGLPAISVSPAKGKLLGLLVQLHGARHVLEVGTLGGYSAIWMARALPPDGHLVTIEVDARHAEVAQANIARAGLGDVVEVRLGRALEVLPELADQDRAPFDFVFIDADKANNAAYLASAVRLSRPGSVIVVDNVIRGGGVVDAASTDPTVVGTRRLFDALAAEPRLAATAIQTVGSKGYDGFVLAVVLEGVVDNVIGVI